MLKEELPKLYVHTTTYEAFKNPDFWALKILIW